MAWVLAEVADLPFANRDRGVAMKQPFLCLVVFILVSVVLAGCDTFFTLDATVTDCGTQVPMAGVDAVLHLDDGYGEEDHHEVTGPDGKLHFVLNEPEHVTATLTLTKAGYQTRSNQYKGQPDMRVEICLDPAAP